MRQQTGSRRAMTHLWGAALLALGGTASATATGIQQTATTDLRLISADAGPGGTVSDGKFVLSEQRSAFSRVNDKELVVSFQWEGSPGDLLTVPEAPHSLDGIEDSAVLLTVAKRG